MRKFSVLIIGAGNIAQGFDEPETSTSIKTHVKGYQFYHDVFDVKAFCDPNEDTLRKVTEKWGLKDSYTSINAIEDFSFDIVSICTPDHTHASVLKQVIDKAPKVIFLEKPMGMNYKEAKQVFQDCQEKGILLLINYSRLFIPAFTDILKYLSESNNQLLSVDIRYHKGFNHNCSHFINLIVFLIQAEVEKIVITDSIIDYSENDPTISVILFMRTNEGQPFKINIQGVDQQLLNLTEIDIISSCRRIIYKESKGSHIHFYTRAEYYDGMVLREFIEDKFLNVDYNEAFINSMGLISNYLNQNYSKSHLERLQQSFLSTVELVDQVQKHHLNYSK